jgi:hypothetical protein
MVHLWDANDVLGAWLVGKFPGLPGSDWDIYLRGHCTAMTGWLGRDERQSQCRPVGLSGPALCIRSPTPG